MTAVLNPEHLVWFEQFVDLGHERTLEALSIVTGVSEKALTKINKLEGWDVMLKKHHFEMVINHRKKRNSIEKLAKTLDITTGTCAKILNRSFQIDELGNVRLDTNGEPMLKDHLSPASATEAASLMTTMATLAKTAAQLGEIDDEKKGKEIDIKLIQQVEDEDLGLWEEMALFEKHNRPIRESAKIKARVLEMRNTEDHGDVIIEIDMGEDDE